MGTTVQQVAGEMSSTPINGQPWNFHGVLDSYLIPRVVARDSKLLPGARLLWAVIRQHSWQNGRCTLSDESLARAVGVQWRQSIRYCRQLERAGLLRTTARPGKTPVRELLWDARFTGKVRKPPVLEDRGGCPPRQGGLPSAAPPFKEEGSFSGSFQVNQAAALKNPPPKPAAPPAEKPAPEWTEEDYLARGRAMGFPEHVIARDIERARARRARPQAERMVKASELASELQAAIRR